jgi:diguanylate cyclase (GGDEF)-like protein/PAS domain S-box-containing protein
MTIPTLLLVDDEEHTVLALEKGLCESFTVFTADSGAIALDILAREDIAIIVADQASVGATGIELMAQVQGIRPGAAGVIISASPTVELFNAALRLGNVFGYISRPWNVDQVKRQLLETAQQQQSAHLEWGRKPGAVATIHDITKYKESEVVVQREQYLLHALLDSVPDAIYFKDLQGRFTRVNRAAADKLGLSDPVLALGKTDFDFFTAEHARPAQEDELEIIRTGQPIVTKEEYETRVDRQATWVLTTKMPLRDQSGQIIGTFGISRDITEKKRTEDRLRYLGSHDELTGLKTRAYFVDELNRLEQDHEYPISIVMVDVDDVKVVNDRWGHPAGDRLLQETADLLRGTFRAGDVIARIGGDEFVVLMPRANETAAVAALDRFKSEIIRHNVGRTGAPLSISMGAATANKGESLKVLMAEADIRMYKDKRGKRISAKYLL